MGMNECEHEITGLHWLLDNNHGTSRLDKSIMTLSVGACSPPGGCQSFDESMATGLTVVCSDPCNENCGISGTVNEADHDECSHYDNMSLIDGQTHGCLDESMRDEFSTIKGVGKPVASNGR